MKIFSFLVIFFSFSFSFLDAQIIKKDSITNHLRLENLPYYSYGRGIGMTSPDSIFQFNIRFRMQNRLTYLQTEDNKSIDGQIRRLRLRFDGFVGNPQFLYVIQLSFAPGDLGGFIEEGENLQVIRDAALTYVPNKNWRFIFGQTKLPGNRQRIVSSGALQLTDRSVNNARFNIDRDFGIQAYYLKQDLNKFSYALKTAISNGEGRNFTQNNDLNFAYTAKLELMPFGAFNRDGNNFEGDLVREKKPKLFLGGVFSQNNFAKKSQGQLGDDLFESRTMTSTFLESLVKYQGFSLAVCYMNRSTLRDPLTFNPLNSNDIRYVWTGEGMDYQGSYLFPKNYELILRYSEIKPYDRISNFEPKRQEFTLGLTKYLWEHAFKLQSEVTFQQANHFNQNTNQWYFRFQLEMGI
jgi:phosphate-selective porin OprO/OprP